MTAAQAPDIELLTRLLWEAEKAAQPNSIAYAERYEDEPVEYRRICEAQAAAALAAGFVRPEDVAEAQALLPVMHETWLRVHTRRFDQSKPDSFYAGVLAAENAVHEVAAEHGIDWHTLRAALRPVDAPEGGAYQWKRNDRADHEAGHPSGFDCDGYAMSSSESCGHVYRGAL